METVFSEYELRETGFKFDGETEYKHADCVGSCEEELDVIVISKKCRGVVKKKRVRGAGTGKLNISLHMPYSIYTEMYGMSLESLIDGVKAYGTNSRHKEFAIVQHVYDEDDNAKLKAYPRCIMESGVARKIENGAEEVAELEMEISLMPDEYGNCMYEVLESDLTDSTLKTNWMTKFEPSMAQKTSA